MQKDNAESGCAERLPKTGKGKEKEVMGRKSEVGANFQPRRTEWEEAYLPLKGGTLRPGGRQNPAAEPSEGLVEKAKPLGRVGWRGKNPAALGASEF